MKRNESAMRVVVETIRAKKGLSLGIVLAVGAAVAASLCPPLLLGRVIDAMTAGEGVPAVWAIGYFALLALAGLMEAARESGLTVFGQAMTHALRSRLMEKMTRLSADELSRQEPGAVAARFVSDVDTVESLFTGGIAGMAADACKIFGILAVIWLRNRGLALVLLLLLPFLFWFTRRVQRGMLAAQMANRRAVGRASSLVPETLKCIRTIRCLGKEDYMAGRYDEAIDAGYRAMEKTNFYDAIYSPVILTLNAVVVAVVMLLSASGNARVLTLFGMSAGTAVAVMNYIGQIFAPVESLGMEIQTIQSAIAGVKRIDEFFAREERNPTGEACGQEPTDAVVELRHVTFGYDEHIVLDDLSFRVLPGERVTLVGRTGAGKSTVFKLLMGLYTPGSGDVLIDGRPAAAMAEAERRRVFGYVEQTFHAVPGTVRDQMTLYDDSIDDEAVRRAAALVGLDKHIETLPQGYDTPCTPALFSQGEWQLISIARAAVADPKIMLLDEITANLDAETEQCVLRALGRASEGRTVISISHRTGAETGRLIMLGGHNAASA